MSSFSASSSVPVPDSNFRDPCHFRHFTLGAPLSSKDGRDVNGGRCDTGRAPAAGELAFSCLAQDLNRTALHLSFEREPGAETRYVVNRGGRRKFKPSSLEINRYVLPISFLRHGTLRRSRQAYGARCTAGRPRRAPLLRHLRCSVPGSGSCPLHHGRPRRRSHARFRGRPRAEAIRSSSESAKARFLSVALLTRILRCHLRRR